MKDRRRLTTTVERLDEERKNKKVYEPSAHGLDWCHVDSEGRRIGYIWPDDMLAVVDSIWGRRKGIAGFSRYAGIARKTTEQYCNGKSPVPRSIALLLLYMQKDVIAGYNQEAAVRRWTRLQTIDADWLPNRPEKFKVDSMPFG